MNDEETIESKPIKKVTTEIPKVLKIAELQSISVQEIEKQTTTNARSLFQIST